MNTEFSKVKLIPILIVYGVIQVSYLIICKLFISNEQFLHLNTLFMLCYIVMIFLFINSSNYRWNGFKRNIQQLGNREIVWCSLLVFMTQFLIALGGYRLMSSILFFWDEPLAQVIHSKPLIEYQGMADLILSCILMTIIIPVFEELLFRGIIFSRLMKIFNSQASLIIMALLFGALHGFDWIGATCFGLLCGTIYLKFNNILVPILIHIFCKTLTIASFLIGIESNAPINSLVLEGVYEQLKGSFVLLIVGLVFLKLTLKRLTSKS